MSKSSRYLWRNEKAPLFGAGLEEEDGDNDLMWLGATCQVIDEPESL